MRRIEMKKLMTAAIIAIAIMAIFATIAEARTVVAGTTAIVGEKNVTFAKNGTRYLDNGTCTIAGGPGSSQYSAAYTKTFTCSAGGSLDLSAAGLPAGSYQVWDNEVASSVDCAARLWECACSPNYGVSNGTAGNPVACTIALQSVVLTASTTSANPAYFGEQVTAVARGQKIVLNATTNLNALNVSTVAARSTPSQCGVDFKIVSPSGTEIKTNGTTDADRSQSLLGVVGSTFDNTPFTVAALVDYGPTNVTVPYNITQKSTINTTGKAAFLLQTKDWAVGDYSLSIKANSSCGLASGYDAGSSVTFSVKDAGVTIASSAASAAINQEVTISGTTQPFETVNITLSKGNATGVIMWQAGKGDYKDTQQLANAGGNGGLCTSGSTCTALGGGAALCAPNVDCSRVQQIATKDGKFSIVPKFNNSGTYEFSATLPNQPTVSNVTVSVKVEEVKMTITTEKTQYITGDKVKIKGTASAGDYVAIAVAGKMKWDSILVTGAGTFEKEWDTAVSPQPSEGSYTIEAWVCPQTLQKGAAGTNCVNSPSSCGTTAACQVTTAFSITSTGGSGTKSEDVYGLDSAKTSSIKKSADATTAVLLLKVSLNVSASPASVAKGDRVTLTGTAPGSDYVFGWVFDTKATTSGGKCRHFKISAADATAGYTFSDKIEAAMSDTSGDYTVFAQTLGRDKTYSDVQSTAECGLALATQSTIPFEGTGTCDCSDDSTGGAYATLQNKYSTQLSALLQNYAEKAGSDDYEVYKVLTYKVVTPSVTLDPCVDTILGSDLTVTGASNRADGTTVLVSATGPQTLDTKSVTVTSGKFTATWSTAGITAGTYTVKADDIKAATDTKTCNVIVGQLARVAIGLSASNTNPELNENVTLTATINNVGQQAAANVALKFSIDGTEKTECAKTVANVAGASNATATCVVNFATAATVTAKVEATCAMCESGYKAANKTVSINAGAPVATTAVATTAVATTAVGTTAVATTATPKPPGFEAVFAIAGLLAVAYIVLRRKQ
jgi:PGF-CTERM protein